MKKQSIARGFLALLVITQTSFGASTLMLARQASAAESPAPTASPSPSDSPEPSDSPSPSVSPSATPSPSADPSPSPDASPSPKASLAPSDSPSPSPSVAAKTTDKSTCKTGPCGPTGVIPSWVFNVGTGLWEAADKASFTYDTVQGIYLSPKYYYNKLDGWYEIIPPSQVAGLPSSMITAPNVVHTAIGDVVIGSPDYKMAQVLGLIDANGDAVGVAGTGSGSTNQASVNNSTQSWFDLTNLVNVINTLQTTAKSGSVTATSNTQVGDAVSGAANVLANIINLLSSAWSWSNGGLNVFMQNLFGNQNGDITLQPTQDVTGGGGGLGQASLSTTGPGSTNDASVTNSNTLGVNAKNSGNIVNNVDANALSGNVNASGNTTVGNLSSGNATVEVNLINLINSFINSGNSFFGVLNIFGNLNGDILFPDGFLNGALASGTGGTAGIGTTGPGSTNQAGVSNAANTNVNGTSDFTVANNVNATAGSGNATLGSNTTAGGASSGSASTNSSTFNLANSSVFGDNAVLVIVNVLGHWIGKVMTLPSTGGMSTSGLLTDNATIGTTGPNSVNNAGVANTSDTNINAANTGSITNNINANAQSGNVTADKNTAVGNVTTGNAKVATGVTNIVNSVLNVKHWFGVLIINVFGSWLGDVGNNTAAGSAAVSIPSAAPAVALPHIVSGQNSTPVVQGSAFTPTTTVASVTPVTTAPVAGQVLAAAAKVADNALAAAKTRNLNFLFWISGGIFLLSGMMFSIERRLRRQA